MKNNKYAIEAILFSSGDSVELKDIVNAVSLNLDETKVLVEELMSEYEQDLRGIRIIRVNNKYQMTTRDIYFDEVKSVLYRPTIANLSQAALETLSIVAYRQPITRAEIEQIRGVHSSSSLSLLLDKNLVERTGKLDVIGRPSVYETTEEFLKMMQITKIEDLKAFDEFKEILDEKEKEIAQDIELSSNKDIKIIKD